ncbi:DNA-primase RepB domain-containing protein [Paenibacillus methanolicus]|uniref:DNA primase RepB-like protein n=1 Tax=Paenibacillus methanolicus TaxID=582686 RepID=A0A5S5BUU3_9BACL|nr:DNA-primase RepB domain-containing protein [Paenibacillus methanolicus]TYP70744.1 DNA primase RepB-like protein [Paenibacillus methanolicus]
MNDRHASYSPVMKKSSEQLHRFIRKLRYKREEKLRFLLVYDVERNGSRLKAPPNANGFRASSASAWSDSHSSGSSSDQGAILLQPPAARLSKSVTQIKLASGRRRAVHLLARNAQGYAVFMGINQGGVKDRDIRRVNAQFIDVDLNKIAESFPTKAELDRRVRALRANPAEQLRMVAVSRDARGQFVLKAQRTEARVAQLKERFLKKYGGLLRQAMIVETKNGYHAYWPVHGGAIAKFVPIQNALTKKFGSDPHITNLSRVMRVPGFYHMKNPDRPFLVRVVRWGRKKPFTQDELVKSLGLKL